MSANNNNSIISEQQPADQNKLWNIMQQRKDMERMIEYMPAPKPVRDYSNVKRSLELNLDTITRDSETRFSMKGQITTSGGKVDIYQDYDYADNTVYEAIKNAMDTIEAVCKPLEAAHAAKREAMWLNIQKLHEDEKTIREDMQKEAADMEAAKKRKAKRAKKTQQMQQPQ